MIGKLLHNLKNIVNLENRLKDKSFQLSLLKQGIQFLPADKQEWAMQIVNNFSYNTNEEEMRIFLKNIFSETLEDIDKEGKYVINRNALDNLVQECMSNGSINSNGLKLGWEIIGNLRNTNNIKNNVINLMKKYGICQDKKMIEVKNICE